MFSSENIKIETGMPGRTVTCKSNVVSHMPAVFFWGVIFSCAVAIDTGAFLLGLMLLRYWRCVILNQ